MKKLLFLNFNNNLKLTFSFLFAAFFSLFTSVGNAQFSQHAYDSLSSGMTSSGAYVLALTMKDSTLISPIYAGGHFAVAGRDSAINIAEFVNVVINSNQVYGNWIPLGKGVNSDVCALVVYNNKLYAGGKFDSASGMAASHIACWDTTLLKWDSLLGKLNGNVYALCVYNNNLYAGGDFTVAEGDTVNRIAMWNGTAWSSVGKGFDTGAVYALTVSNDTLYAGGSFLKSNGIPVNRIAKWNGTYWDSLGSGINNTVYALADYDGSLYAGGAFTLSGNISTNYISFINYGSQTWNALGVGTNDTVRALNAGGGAFFTVIKKRTHQAESGGPELLAGGNFTLAGGNSSTYIAGWYSGSWDALGELNGPVFALSNPSQAFSGANYVGGRFSKAEFDTVNNVAYLNIVVSSSIPSNNDIFSSAVYPNPNNGEMNIKLSGSGYSSLKLDDVFGREVYNQLLDAKQSDLFFTINAGNLSNGVYFMQIENRGGIISKQVVMEK